MAKITIEGTVDQVASAFGVEALTPRQQALAANRQRRADLITKRRIVRRAFDLVRHDAAQIDTADHFAGALGGRYQLDQAVVERAERIIKERS